MDHDEKVQAIRDLIGPVQTATVLELCKLFEVGIEPGQVKLHMDITVLPSVENKLTGIEENITRAWRW